MAINNFYMHQYPKSIIESENNNVQSIKQEFVLRQSSKKDSIDHIPFILPFQPSIYPLRHIIFKHYKTHMTDLSTKDILKLLPITSCIGKRNLNSQLGHRSHSIPAMCSDTGTYSCKCRHCNICKLAINCSAKHIDSPKGSYNLTKTFTIISKKLYTALYVNNVISFM